MPIPPQFAVRNLFIVMTAFAIYLSLAQVYGFGRAIVCFLTLCLAASSSLFFVASYHSAKEEQLRNGLACGLLGLTILVGAALIGFIVFQLPPQTLIELPSS